MKLLANALIRPSIGCFRVTSWIGMSSPENNPRNNTKIARKTKSNLEAPTSVQISVQNDVAFRAYQKRLRNEAKGCRTFAITLGVILTFRNTEGVVLRIARMRKVI